MGFSYRNITKYLKDAVASQQTQQLEITEKAIKIPFSAIKMGRVTLTSCQYLFDKEIRTRDTERESTNNNTKEKSLKIIIVAQVINIKAESGIKRESTIKDLTGTFFIPAVLNESGILSPDQESIPWIPRVYLSPIMDKALIVGKIQDVDSYITSHTKELFDLRSIGNWKDYINFAEDFWKSVNDTQLDGNFLYNYVQEKHPLVLDNSVYIIPNDTIASIHHIKKLYEYALTDAEPYNKLYERIIKVVPESNLPLVNNLLPQMKQHMGQMSGIYPLSPSQREAINHFTTINDGDVLAVNGPPGTGKTTLLQSIVADMVVKRALSKDEAPIIVATSTNNQAVTNIIESFAAINNGEHPKKIDEHWISNKKSFATYFPSQSKSKDALKKGYQVTDVYMGHTIEKWEKEEAKSIFRKDIIKYCCDLFGEEKLTLDQCCEKLHKMLSDFELHRHEMLNLAEQIPFEIQIFSNDVQRNLKNIEHELIACQKKEDEYKARLLQWELFLNKLILYRIFKFIPYIRERLNLKLINFRSLDESELPSDSLSFYDVEKYYKGKLENNRIVYEGYKIAHHLLEKSLFFKQVDVNVFASKKTTISLELNSLNELFDTNIRFYEFWLSIHYFECRWLLEEYRVDPKDLFKSTSAIMTNKYRRLCMLTPCLVMTFFMLPSNFNKYKDKYLYDFIDLLIVDEAGQVSPEIGIASFLLAKKALIVGDIYQIEPVWSVPRELDIALAIGCNVIPPGSFNILEESGFNTSESSLMKVASNSCSYEKFEKKGLLLTEHRRCYNELIDYCNDLVYNGKLEPLRGTSLEDSSYPFNGKDTLEHIQVSTASSEKKNSSRYNPNESNKIREWLNENFDTIKKAYPKDSTDRLVGIITPFKAQADYIRKELKDFSQDIMVGTVHAFQGGERRIILFSTVYGADEGCPFLDFKPNLMNVAMSRSKDRFIVFGDINCLSDSKEKPSGLLRFYCQQTL